MAALAFTSAWQPAVHDAPAARAPAIQALPAATSASARGDNSQSQSWLSSSPLPSAVVAAAAATWAGCYALSARGRARGSHARMRVSVCATKTTAIKTFERLEPEDPADALIPQQPIGRLVSKYDIAALEYDPSDAPEYVADEFGNGQFVWEPLSPEGGMLGPGEYAEQSFPVPEDKIDYLIGAGWLHSDGEEDYRAYVDDSVTESSDGRRWRNVVLKGSCDGVQAGSMRLMAGVLRRRPWDPPESLPESAKQDALPASS
eukprot:TRINITY_DN74125_c0_g1_i1.p1 TRINITY_DN74125_c0_g1~~TRINITY_DN74125_c0_g1_i1.p1  ORF type:complete len:260 (+),score=39.80 TRINITY_DN74125_c0_g1_i1:118-897(+)